MPNNIEISAEEALQAQFAKVGMLIYERDILQQQLVKFESENKKLRETLSKFQKEPDAKDSTEE